LDATPRGEKEVDEVPRDRAKLAFQVISERYDHRRATAIATNRAFKDWTKVFPDPLKRPGDRRPTHRAK
jgi:DNA replication protein DnaC